MGVDYFDLVMRIEETFDIKISSEDLEKVRTVGDLYDYIESRTNIAKPGTCLAAIAFCDIQSSLKQLGIQEKFGPSTELEEIFPKSNRRELWDDLSNTLQLVFPGLVRSRRVILTNIFITISMSVTLLIGSWILEENGSFNFGVGIVHLIIFGSLTTILSIPFATNFDTTFKTFRGLSERIVAINRVKLREQHGFMGRNDIWVSLREIIVDSLGVDHDEVVREADLVKDLACE